MGTCTCKGPGVTVMACCERGREVGFEARTVSVFSETGNRKAKAICISDLVMAGAGVGQALKCCKVFIQKYLTLSALVA